MRVLVMEDDPDTLAYIAKGLEQEGHTVDRSADGKEGLFLALEHQHDAIVVDRMLPGLDGLSVVQSLRAAEKRTPVLILSALGEVDDRVEGLRKGGDDYLTKPFAFAELLARVQALLRRMPGTGEPTHLRVADLTIDLLSREVTRGGQRIELRPREFALLEYLARHPGQVVSKTMILSRIWNYAFDPRTNVVDVLVHRLREKIDGAFEPKLLHTRRGVGYVLGPATGAS